MQVYVMTAMTEGQPRQFFGVVIGRTLDECKQNASAKWKWYPGDYATRYFAGFPKVTTRRMTL